MLDLIIIGAGLTGLIAAQAAAEAGLKVRVIAKGLGATHWNAGAIDLLGYYPAGASAPVEQPVEAIAQMAHDYPQHPYALAGIAGIEAALHQFVPLSNHLGLPYVGASTPGHNLLLPSPAGAARPTYLAPLAQQVGDLARSEPMLIVGFKGMRDLYPDLVAANLQALGCTARAAQLPVSLITDRSDFNTVHLATELENPARQKRLASEVTKIARRGERIGLPAILGLNKHTVVIDALQSALGAPVFEIPTLPPSVPGIRLTSALRRKLEEMNVRVEANMEVIAFHAENGRVEWLETATSARPLKHRAGKFLLATGGLLGGGLNTDHTGRVWDTVLDLPVHAPAQREDWFRARFTDAQGHPIFAAGVQVDCNWQPVDESGQLVYDNVWAAGSILAHADPIRERSLEGIALVTALAAIKQIVASR